MPEGGVLGPGEHHHGKLEQQLAGGLGEDGEAVEDAGAGEGLVLAKLLLPPPDLPRVPHLQRPVGWHDSCSTYN